MEKLDLELLEKIAQLHSVPEGSFNIRKNGERLAANSTDEIQIVQKTDKPGIDIIVAAGVKNKSVHIPVILTVGDFQDTVYNDFFIGEDADVTIVAGCGIHNPGKGKAEHDGVHTFHLGKNSRVKYVERHYGEGVQGSKRVFDPVTNAFLESGSVLEMDTTQLGGVTFTDRMTEAVVGDGAKLLVKEKLLTDGDEKAISRFRVTLKGKDSTCDIVSRSVAGALPARSSTQTSSAKTAVSDTWNATASSWTARASSPPRRSTPHTPTPASCTKRRWARSQATSSSNS